MRNCSGSAPSRSHGPSTSVRANPDRAADGEATRGLALATVKGHPWFMTELAYRLWQATDRKDRPNRRLHHTDC